MHFYAWLIKPNASLQRRPLAGVRCKALLGPIAHHANIDLSVNVGPLF